LACTTTLGSVVSSATGTPSFFRGVIQEHTADLRAEDAQGS